MNPLQRFRGTDAARLDLLAARATEAAHRLTISRTLIRHALGDGATGPTSTDATLAALQAWLEEVAADARRRSGITASDDLAATGTLDAGAGIRGSGAHLGPVVTTTVTDPVLHDDGATGLHLQGYIGVGLAWRHIGTETRTKTTATDFGGGWVRTDTWTQKRGVYDVEFGIGYGPKRLGGLSEHRQHDAWRNGHRRTSYSHDGAPVSGDDFEAATGDR